jgi:hypothetical protein
MVDPAADNRAVGELRPISCPNDAGIARSNVQQAIRIAAKRVIECVRVHEVANAPPALKGLRNAGFRYLVLYTVPRMARDFNVTRLSDEFGQYLLYLKCSGCAHERQTYPNLLAHLCGWDATLQTVEKRLRCSKCGKKRCHIRAVPLQKPRGIPPSH